MIRQERPTAWLVPWIALAALMTGGCQRVLFAFVNHGSDRPDATVEYAPDRRLALDVYRARGDVPASGAPTVVFFHGGSWNSGHREQYRFVGNRLADNGVLTLVADYRTYPTAGFPAFMDDAADAVAWAHAHAAGYGGDPSRLYVAGHSAGAQIAALLGTDASYLARRGIAPRQLRGVIGLSGPYDFTIGEYAPIFGPPSQWPKAQAVNSVNGDEPAFLLLQGQDDTTVAPRNSIELAAKLRAAHVPVTLQLVPGAGHLATVAALYDPKRAPMVLPAILHFIEASGAPP